MNPEQQSYQPTPVQQPIPVQYPPTRNVKAIVFKVIFVLLIAGASFAGGLVAGQASQKSVSDKQVAAANAEVTRLKRTYSGEEVTDLPGVTYLNIKEWNIRLPIDGKYKDVNYRFRTRLNNNFVEIYSPSIAAIATCRDYQGEIGIIERAAAGTVPTPTSNVVGLEKFLYMYKEKAETCTTNPANLEAPYKASLIKQFAGLELLPNSQRDATTKSTTPDVSTSNQTTTNE